MVELMPETKTHEKGKLIGIGFTFSQQAKNASINNNTLTIRLPIPETSINDIVKILKYNQRIQHDLPSAPLQASG